jgi:hypothetical protein
MEYLILGLILIMGYLVFQMRKEEGKDDFDTIKTALDKTLEESPYKIEPLRDIIVKKRTRKKTGRVVTPKKDLPKKKLKVTKKKTKRKTKRKTK